MKTNAMTKSLCGFMIGITLLVSRIGQAQTFRSLHDFNGNDGSNPESSLILSGDKLWGTTFAGGSCSNGTLFAVRVDGTSFTNQHHFSNLITISNQIVIPPGTIPVTVYSYTNSDGANPAASLVLAGNTLYGTASTGGSAGKGTVFSINANGTGFTTLHHFTGSDGANPIAGLILAGNILYGTATAGGSGSSGSVYSIKTDGTGFTTLYSFSAGNFNPNLVTITNTDGASPKAGLIMSGGMLYGTSSAGGTSGGGTVFALATNGTGFTNLHNFAGIEGSNPRGSLVMLSNLLYGTTRIGGSWSDGTIFAIGTNGLGFTNLYSFSAYISNFVANADGAQPLAGVTLFGNNLYGTTSTYGSPGSGTLFVLNPDGTGFTVLHQFLSGEGFAASAGLLPVGNSLFGTAKNGGNSNGGTLFSLSLTLPQLRIIRSGTNAILSWPTTNFGINYSGFTLQSATNVLSPIWTSELRVPNLFSDRFIITNPMTGTQKFYRLVQ
jgi:uncharacterized repeat protein (TIGR03803 family)